MQACAVVVKPEHFQAILSENANNFDLAFMKAWVAENEAGYFLRDEASPLDCLLIEESKFLQLYMFERGDQDAMFRAVTKH